MNLISLFNNTEVTALSLLLIIILEIYQIINEKKEKKKLKEKVNFHDEIINEFTQSWSNNFKMWQKQHEINLKLFEKVHEIKGEEVDELLEKIKEIDPEKFRHHKRDDK